MTESSPRFLMGRVLIAKSSLRDPNFSRSVILIVEHDERGAFGLVLNDPLPLSLGQVIAVEDPSLDWGSSPLFRGGPVQPETLFFLHERAEIEGVAVLDAVRLSGDEDALRQLFESDAKLARARFFGGYAGWGRGQLEAELAEGAWVSAPAHAEWLWEIEPKRLWPLVLGSLGGRWAIMGQTPDEPDLN